MLPPPTCQIALLRQKKTWSHSSPNRFCQNRESNQTISFKIFAIFRSLFTLKWKKKLKSSQHVTSSLAHLVPNFSAMEVLKRSQVVKKSNWLEMLDLSRDPGRGWNSLILVFERRTVKAQKDVLILVDYTDSYIRYPKTCNVIYIYLCVCTYASSTSTSAIFVSFLMVINSVDSIDWDWVFCSLQCHQSNSSLLEVSNIIRSVEFHTNIPQRKRRRSWWRTLLVET